MHRAFLSRISVAAEHGRVVRAHALLRLDRGADALRGEAMSPPDDVMGAALVLVRAAQTPTQRVEVFSQRNCDLLGLTKRVFLELLRRPDAPPVLAIGKLRMVRRDVMLAFLERLSGRTARRALAEPDGADAVLREIGCATVRRGRS